LSLTWVPKLSYPGLRMYVETKRIVLQHEVGTQAVAPCNGPVFISKVRSRDGTIAWYKCLWERTTGLQNLMRGYRGSIVVGFTTTYAISVYHHQSYEFKYRSCPWRGVIDTTLGGNVCQWLATGRWFSLCTLDIWFPPSIKLTAYILLKYCWKWR